TFIYSKLKHTLEANGLKEMNPLNELFNPMEHEAIRYEKVSDESKKDKVIEVIEKGYMLGTKNLRPPKVVVGEYEKVEK
ncbi:MAG TPA: nucleotide exchange factor GrpE, partial [Candidatus Paceibacterota bacterium]|nr:nucleotide exchange factor GrpE [Candidatus Paceibacterota bacterium]